MQIKENETVLENRKRTKKNLQAYRYSVAWFLVSMQCDVLRNSL